MSYALTNKPSNFRSPPINRPFASWCVLDQARLPLVKVLNTWGLNKAANGIAGADSLGMLRDAIITADAEVRRHIKFGPLKRDLLSAINTCQAALTFAVRGDAENTPVMVIGVFTSALSAELWRRPWLRFSWRQRKAAIIESTRRAQIDYLKAST